MPAAIWAACVAAFDWIITRKLGQWIMGALLSFGITLVATKYVSGPAISSVQQYFAGMPATIAQWMAFFGADRVVTIILSAYAAAATTNALKFRKKAAA